MSRLLQSSVGQRLARTLTQGHGIEQLRQGVMLPHFFSSTSDDGTHDDFKPKIKGEPAATVADQISADIKSYDVFVYMKGVPQAPMCGFSNMACRILDAYEVEYGSRDVLSDPELREGIKKYTHWPTIPQIFIKGEFIGGSDILMQMHQSGELTKTLKDEK